MYDMSLVRRRTEAEQQLNANKNYNQSVWLEQCQRATVQLSAAAQTAHTDKGDGVKDTGAYILSHSSTRYNADS